MPKPLAIAIRITALLTLSSASAGAGDAGHAIQLDGISGYLGCDLPGATRSSELTLSAWILRAGPRGELISPEPRGQAAVGLGFHFGLSAGKVFCAKGNGSGVYIVLTGNTSVPVSEWHHVAATLDNGTMRVYLDGLLDGELADASAVEWGDLPPTFPRARTTIRLRRSSTWGPTSTISWVSGRPFPISTSSKGPSTRLRSGIAL